MAAVIPVLTKLSPRVIRVLGCNPSPMTLQGTNTYIIGTGKRRILVDTGEGDIPEYINYIRAILIHEEFTLSHIFLSHWHHDHVGGLLDVIEIKENTPFCQVWKYPASHNEDSELLSALTLNYFKDGQEFSVEGATIRIIHTPGHTADHVSFLLVEENAILSGDSILGEGTCVFENLYDYTSSLITMLELQPKVIYPGHGNVIHRPQEKIQYYIHLRNECEQQILETLEEKPDQLFNEMDLVKSIYRDIPEKLCKAVAFNVNHHLLKLSKEDRIVKIDNMWKYRNLPMNSTIKIITT